MLDLELKAQSKENKRSRKQVTALKKVAIVDPPLDISTANMIVDLTGQLVIKKPKFKPAINSMRKSSDAANTLLMLRSSQGEAVTPALVEAALQSLKIQFPFMASVADFLLALVAGHVSSVNYASLPATALLADTARVHTSSENKSRRLHSFAFFLPTQRRNSMSHEIRTHTHTHTHNTHTHTHTHTI